jgi:hypothetical protein
MAAVNFARNNGLLLSVRGGGHNVAGSAVAEGGLTCTEFLWRKLESLPYIYEGW